MLNAPRQHDGLQAPGAASVPSQVRLMTDETPASATRASHGAVLSVCVAPPMTVVLSAAVLVLVLLHFLTPWMPSAVAERLHLNSEASLPAWFSSSLLMAVSLGTLLVVLRAARRQDKALAWRALCGGYACLSADEA